MSTVPERLPVAELERRYERCRRLLAERMPGVGGILVFSLANIYYFTGTVAPAVLWLPLEGDPVLMVRKGADRAVRESPLHHVSPFRGYGDIAGICAGCGSALTARAGAEKSAVTWAMAENLQARLQPVVLEDAGAVLARARAVKSEMELEALRRAGQAHQAAYAAMGGWLRPGMTERDISVRLVREFLDREHAGFARGANPLVSEIVYGAVAAGESALHPFPWDGTLGGPGGHPATPHLGSPAVVWKRNSPLVVDTVFNRYGYHTDVTQVFWSGPPDSLPDAARRAQETCVEIYGQAESMLKTGAIASHIWRRMLPLAEKAGFADVYMGLGGNRVRFLGHGVGLTLNEFPVIAEGFEEPLESGMTIALEPKISLAGLGMMGLEGVFAVTERGGVSLTGDRMDIRHISG
jgi:Xaa-Pro aminopeptidase